MSFLFRVHISGNGNVLFLNSENYIPNEEQNHHIRDLSDLSEVYFNTRYPNEEYFIPTKKEAKTI